MRNFGYTFVLLLLFAVMLTLPFVARYLYWHNEFEWLENDQGAFFGVPTVFVEVALIATAACVISKWCEES